MNHNSNSSQEANEALLQSTCLSLSDGYYGECSLVEKHNQEIGASQDDILAVPRDLSLEFQKLSPAIKNLSRAFELGLYNNHQIC